MSVCCTDCKKADAVRFFHVTNDDWPDGFFAWCPECTKGCDQMIIEQHLLDGTTEELSEQEFLVSEVMGS